MDISKFPGFSGLFGLISLIKIQFKVTAVDDSGHWSKPGLGPAIGHEKCCQRREVT